MAKKTMVRKKYGLGTSGVSVKNYLQSPGETLAKHDILMSKAELEAQSNPLAMGVELGTQLLSQVASSGKLMKKKDISGNDMFSGGDFMTPEEQFSFENEKTIAAMGNSAIPEGEVELEGEEVIQTPNGEVAELKGPSHEQGGIPMEVGSPNSQLVPGSVPENSEAFSKRVFRGGKNMADRKLSRERSKESLLGLLDKGKTDLAIKNTVNRKLSNLEREEAEDLAFQEMASLFSQVQEFAYGSGKRGIKKYAMGSTGLGTPKPWELPVSTRQDDPNNMPDADGDGVPDSIDINSMNPVIENPEVRTFTEPTLPIDTKVNTPAPGKIPALKTVNPKTKQKGYVPTVGDILTLGGTAYSAFAPMDNTLQNRAGDTANTNEFKDFGKASLDTLARAAGFLSQEKDNSNRKLASASRGAKKAGRAGARGVNQMRAMDLATDINTTNAQADIDTSFANKTLGLLGQKAGLESNIDQIVMAGEQAADLANRQDRDNFYTQLGKDKAGKGKGIQQLGKNVNDMLQNPILLNLLQNMGQYVSMDAQGNFVAKETKKRNNNTKTQ